MSIICRLGFHSWEGKGCKCKKCGKVRDKDELHNWIRGGEGCKCFDCGKIRNVNHNWKGCKCLTCGTLRGEYHDWSKDCCRCSICSKTRNESHDWSKDCEKCSKCDQTRRDQHDYTNEVCSKCGKLFNEGYFTDSRDGEKYKWVRFGKQIVMMQNMAFKPEFGNVSGDKLNTRGYLYDWETALKISPMGWHLPTEAEWLSVIHEFVEYCWKHFDQDTPFLIKGYDIRNGYCDIKGKINDDGRSHYWSASESPSNGATGFVFNRWYDYASGDGSFQKDIFDRSLGLSVILFRDL